MFFRVSGKSPLENSHPENSPLENPTQKIPPKKIPIRNIPTHVFKHFVFSLLSLSSLILLKRLFRLLKMLKSDLLWCIKKKFAACLLFRKCFGCDGNVFHIFIQEMFNFSKIRLHQKDVSKESKKTCEESFCMLKTTFFYCIHVTTCFYASHFLL